MLKENEYASIARGTIFRQLKITGANQEQSRERYISTKALWVASLTFLSPLTGKLSNDTNQFASL